MLPSAPTLRSPAPPPAPCPSALGRRPRPPQGCTSLHLTSLGVFFCLQLPCKRPHHRATPASTRPAQACFPGSQLPWLEPPPHHRDAPCQHDLRQAHAAGVVAHDDGAEDGAGVVCDDFVVCLAAGADAAGAVDLRGGVEGRAGGRRREAGWGRARGHGARACGLRPGQLLYASVRLAQRQRRTVGAPSVITLQLCIGVHGECMLEMHPRMLEMNPRDLLVLLQRWRTSGWSTARGLPEPRRRTCTSPASPSYSWTM